MSYLASVANFPVSGSSHNHSIPFEHFTLNFKQRAKLHPILVLPNEIVLTKSVPNTVQAGYKWLNLINSVFLHPFFSGNCYRMSGKSNCSDGISEHHNDGTGLPVQSRTNKEYIEMFV